MEMVAASKMRRAVSQVMISREYSNIAWDVIQKIAGSAGQKKHPLLKIHNKITRQAVLAISSNRGLCGGFNGNLTKKTIQYCHNLRVKNIDFECITLGKKIAHALQKNKFNIIADFDKPDLMQDISTISPITNLLLNGFKTNQYQSVTLIYTDFQSALKQEPIVKQLLPLQTTPDDSLGNVGLQDKPKYKPEINTRPKTTILEYKFEPDPTKVLDQILPRILEIQIYQAVLESDASEHSARMMAMKNAYTSASDMIDSLTLAFNQARQAAITQEISEIVAGANAI